MRRSSPLLLLLFASLAAAGDVDERVVDRHASFLGAEELGEVRAGSPGYAVSLRYIATEMERLGYAGAGRGGDWFFAREIIEQRPGSGTRLLRSSGEALGRDAFSALPLSGEGGFRGKLSILGQRPRPPLSAGGTVLLVVRADGETLDAAAARAALSSPGAILVADPRPARGVDEVHLTDGRVLVGKVVDRGREFLVRVAGTGRILRLTAERVREIRFGMGRDVSTYWSWRESAPESMRVPVVKVTHAAIETLTGMPLRVLLRDGAPDGLSLTVRVVFERRAREIREVRAANAKPGAKVVTIATRIDRGEKGAAAAAALTVAALLAGQRDARVEYRFVFGSRDSEEDDPNAIVVESGADPARTALRAQWVRAFESMPESPPVSVEPLPPQPPSRGPLRAARAARLRGDTETAVKLIRIYRSAERSDPEVLLEDGRIRLAAGDLAGALSLAEYLERLDEGKSRGHLLRAEILYAQGDAEAGDAALDAACVAGLPEAFLMRAFRRTPAGDPPEAMREDLRSAFEKAGDSALGDCARGLLLLSLGHVEPAEEMLTKALEKDDLLSLAYRYRAEARAALDRDPAEVARDCDAALALGVEGASVWFTRGLARLRSRFFTLAIRDFERCIEAGMDPASATYNIACAHALAGSHEEALEWLARSLQEGFRDFQHARQDPDLDLLKDDPRFEGILRSRREE